MTMKQLVAKEITKKKKKERKGMLKFVSSDAKIYLIELLYKNLLMCIKTVFIISSSSQIERVLQQSGKINGKACADLYVWRQKVMGRVVITLIFFLTMEYFDHAGYYYFKHSFFIF